MTTFVNFDSYGVEEIEVVGSSFQGIAIFLDIEGIGSKTEN